MRHTAKVNAMRSGVVVMGALAFGYLTLELGFKPYLEKAQREQEALHGAQSDSSADDGFNSDNATVLSDEMPKSDYKL